VAVTARTTCARAAIFSAAQTTPIIRGIGRIKMIERLRARAGKPFMREDSMVKKMKRKQRQAPKEDWIEADLPVVGAILDDQR
jgi:hypothetical protein